MQGQAGKQDATRSQAGAAGGGVSGDVGAPGGGLAVDGGHQPAAPKAVTELPRLSRGLMPAPARPLRIIQFGEGNFLRAFLDWQIQRLNRQGLFDGDVAVVQPLPSGRVAALEQQDRLYTVLLEGRQGGCDVRTHEVIDVIGETVDVYAQWSRFLALADEPAVQVIVSNTTEAGIALDPTDSPEGAPPASYPAKLTALLYRRYRAGLPGFVIIPCELIEDNGGALLKAVRECARRFKLGAEFDLWLRTRNTFCSSLVDRIVPGYPRDREQELWQELGYVDESIVAAEPFMLWVIEGPAEQVEALLPLREAGLDVVFTDDLRPYRDRKVFLLNGPHTTMAMLGRLAGLATVGETITDPDFRAFIAAEMHEEIAPVVKLPETELERFAFEVVERFENPYSHHALDAIALNSVAKFRARLLPVIKGNFEREGKLPARVVAALAALLVSYAGRGSLTVPVEDAEPVRQAFDRVAGSAELVPAILRNSSLWGEDISLIPGLVAAVQETVDALVRDGARAVVKSLA